MKKQQFDPKEYAKLKEKVEKIQAKLWADSKLDRERVRRLLVKVEKKVETYEETHKIPKLLNVEGYTKLKCRVELFKSSVKFGTNVKKEISKQLLSKVEKQIEIYEQIYNIHKETSMDCNTTSRFDFWNFIWDEPVHQCNEIKKNEDNNYQADTRSENEKINNLGILYVIFGNTYHAVLNYHEYRIQFKEQVQIEESKYQIYTDIYEDNVIIYKNALIEIWTTNFEGDNSAYIYICKTRNSLIQKYDKGSGIYEKLIRELKDVLNFYLDEQDYSQMKIGHIEPFLRSITTNNEIEILLSYEERKKIIDKTEEEIAFGKTSPLGSMASFTKERVAHKVYRNLRELLEESGEVYKVEYSGVYIWSFGQKKWVKLVGYEYIRVWHRDYLYLL